MDSQVLTDLTDIGDGDLTDWLTIGSKHHQASSKDKVYLTDWLDWDWELGEAIQGWNQNWLTLTSDLIILSY